VPARSRHSLKRIFTGCAIATANGLHSLRHVAAVFAPSDDSPNGIGNSRIRRCTTDSTGAKVARPRTATLPAARLLDPFSAEFAYHNRRC
jgi:hypothetical protein